MIRITCLIENSTFRPKLYAKQGVSLFVEYQDKNILFDVGQDFDTLKHNSDVLKIDLNSIDAIVISHKDFDHIGALPKLIKNLKTTPKIYIVDDYKIEGKPLNSIFSELEWSYVEEYENLEKINKGLEIFPDIFITEPQEYNLKESSLVLKHFENIIVLVGCSHPGIDVMVEAAKNVSGVSTVSGIIGGFHLVSSSSKDIQKKTNYLKKQEMEFMTCMHCTGYKAVNNFEIELQDVLKLNSLGVFGVGNSIEINDKFKLKTILGDIV